MKKETGDERAPISYLKGSNFWRQVLAAALSYGGVCALPWMFCAGRESLEYTNSILPVFLFFALFWLTGKALCAGAAGKAGRWLWPGCVGGLFAVCMVFGAQLDEKGSVPFQNGGMWAAILVLAVLCTLVIRYFWDLMAVRGMGRKSLIEGRGSEAEGLERRDSERKGFEGKASEGESPEGKGPGGKSRRGLFVTAAVIFLCYLPVFLAVYPGFFVYDAQEEYLQVVTRNFSTHHPLVHVLLLGGIIHLIYKLTGSYNLGIACYTLLQMTVMSFIFAWCVEKLTARGMKRPGRILLTLYFGLCPVLVMFSLCSAKDGLFAGMLLVAVLLLQELAAGPEEFFREKKKAALLSAASLFMMLLRHNGFYAFLVFAVICILCLRKYWKKLGMYFSGIFLLYVAVSALLAGIFHADSGENQEILTVPISQVARVYGDEREKLSLEEKELLCRYLPEEALLRYTPKVSDGVKIDFDNEAFEADRAGFFRLWLKWGASHPFTYLNAWFMTSYGFWYPDTVIDVYRGNTVFTYTYGDSSYFGYEVEEPGSRESKLSRLNELYRRMSLEIAQQRIPVVSMLFSPGFLFWVLAFVMGFLCDRGCWRKVLPFVLPLLVWLTVILGPTYLVRYVVFLWAMAPLLVWEM